ncbi:hypothetical protein SAMN05192553_103482 [Cyclobacterium xiamenense]|uniref:Lipocalin-like domain-containing protein n=1 Tax=Cyclobacterium xiamenense TaxID=1297121 RepID=A0A1H6YGQ8_9BACT|nr:hypothetical protein [Cyclobacterium xiamenense]SEJ36412.1 hypothetical protein SAMN05192553_103482 [Cyclobacterium xiamenense]
MVAITRILLVLFLAVNLVRCGDEEPQPTPPEPSDEEVAIEKLTGTSGNETWVLRNGGSVTKDGTNETDDYIDFEITFISSGSSKTYTTQGSNLLFDTNGNWSFAGGNFDKIELTGVQPAANKEISFTQEDNDLQLQWTVPAPSNARVSALAGSYVFALVRLE